MEWNEVTIETNTLGSELVADIISQNGSDVSIFDGQDFADLINNKEVSVSWDYYDDRLKNFSDIVLCKGYFSNEDINEAISQIRNDLIDLKDNTEFDIGSLKVEVKKFNDEDWNNEWKKYYKKIDIGQYSVIPVWEEYENNKKINVIINPGMAFGTGEHESTKLCLGLLSEIEVKGKHVIDMGTGSGILGVAAAKTEAASIDMFDIDPLAIENANENAKLNGVEKVVSLKVKSSINDYNKKVDIILANITADILISMKNDFYNHLNKLGYLIMSGIINSRYNDILEAFSKQGFKLDKRVVMGEWTGVRFIKDGN